MSKYPASGLLLILQKLSPNTTIPDIETDNNQHALRQTERLRDWVAAADKVLSLNSVDTYLLSLRMAIIGLAALSVFSFLSGDMTPTLTVAVVFSAVVSAMLYVSVRRNNTLTHWERWVPNIYLMLPHSYGLYVNGTQASSVTLAVIMISYMTLPRGSARVVTAWYLTAFIALWANGTADPGLMLRQSMTILLSVMFLDALTGRIETIVKFMRDLLRNLQSLRENVDNEYLQHRNDYARLRRFRRQLDLARDVLLIVRLSDGLIVDCNKSAENVTGYSRSALLDTHLWQLLEKIGNEDGYFDLSKRLIEKASYRDETALATANNKRLPIELEITVEESSDLMLVLARDISDRIRTEQQIRRSHQDADAARTEAEKALVRAEIANNAKTQFMARMSHELRTPLNNIDGALHLLRKNADEQSTRYIDGAMQASAKLMSMLSDIMDVANTESGQLTLDLAVFEPARIALDLENEFKPKAEDKQILLTVKGGADLPKRLIGDELRIRKICTHIIDNAIKYTDQGKVSVEFEAMPGRNPAEQESIQLFMRVQDTGSGIAPENMGRVFDTFTTASNDTQMESEGVGIGLALCQRLARSMGGDIELKSSQGAGTRVELTVELGLA